MRLLRPGVDRGSGIPLLFIHAFPLNQRMWRPQIEHFELSFRVITIDLPGFGSAPPAARAVTLEEISVDISRFLDNLEIERCAVIGLSLGGYTAFNLLRLQPKRFLALVLAHTRAGADDETARSNRHRQAAEIRAGGMEQFIDTMMTRLPGASTRRHRPAVLDEARAIMQDASVEGTARMLETMAVRKDASDLLAQMDFPVCVIAGAEDEITPPDEMRLMADSIPGAEYHLIPRAGHLSNLEEPESFNRIVSTFLLTCPD